MSDLTAAPDLDKSDLTAAPDSAEDSPIQPVPAEPPRRAALYPIPMSGPLSDEQIAMVAHAVNFAYCAAIGESGAVSWHEATPGVRESIINGVAFVRQNPMAGPAAMHSNWMDFKLADGWKYGPVKDFVEKTHPNLIAYERLPAAQRAKDSIFHAVVSSLLQRD